MKNRLLVIFSVILLMNSNKLYAQGYLRTQGKLIINDNGPILLRGLNLGNWLVNEGYMMEMVPAADAPYEIREKLESMIGEENTDKFYDIYRNHYIQEKDIDTIAKLGFNHVRLPFHYNLLTPEDSPGVYYKEGFKYLDSAIAWAKKRQMYVILDMHCVPGASNAAGHGDSHGKADLWNYKYNQDRFYEVWKYIAKKYVDEPWVGGYDLVNESVNTADQPENKLMREVFIRATDSIRTIDKKHIIYIEGNWYASDFNGLTPPWDNNMVYSFHKYWVPPTTEHMQYLLDIMNNYDVPLWLGEAGENSNNWYFDLIKLLEENNIGWCWWTYKKPNSITAPFKLTFTPGWLRLKDYFKGAIDKPSKDFMTNALLHFAANTTLENSQYKPDVHQAMIRKDYDILSSPWPLASNKIPGRIEAVNYDTGKNGIAYSDRIYETRSGSPFLTWNDNWVGRNDGVDMQVQTDSTGAEYNITGIENGEWVQYTLDIQREGKYRVDFRIASASSGSKIILKIDGKKQKKLKVSSTMGSNTWKILSVSGMELRKGIHILRLNFKKGGFKLNYLNFVYMH